MNKNPFGDFSSFEDSVDKMTPIVQDENQKKMFESVEQKLKQKQNATQS